MKIFCLIIMAWKILVCFHGSYNRETENQRVQMMISLLINFIVFYYILTI